MFDWTTATISTLACVVILYFRRWASKSRSLYPLPPGPPGLPWIGSVIGVNPDAPWLTYGKWAKSYGDIVYSRQMGRDIIVLNSEKVAKDLLEDRSRIHSDRPYFVTTEMCGLDFNSVLLPYGDRWRLHRRFFHKTFRLEAVPRFVPLLHSKACTFLLRLLDDPEQLNDHVFEYTTSIILNSTYDYNPTSRTDELVDIVADVLKVLVPAFRPDVSVMLGAFPLLIYLPSWFPYMSFKKQMAKARIFSEMYLERPFQYSLQRPTCDSTSPSMVHDALQDIEDRGVLPVEPWMQALKEATGTAFLSASSTTHSQLMTFFLVMVLNPAAQEKAQAQIDAVVGNSRLPTIDDRPSLPFVDAILWETFRSHPISPLSLPHGAVDDDVYGGFRIPKGSILLANVWSMAHDESRYPNADTFIPERFLNDDGSLKRNDIDYLAFGFGRRSCVGKHLADALVWSVIAKVLAVFKVLRPLDEHGVEIPVEPRFLSGITIRPLPFGFRIVPRFPDMDTEKLEQLIANSSA